MRITDTLRTAPNGKPPAAPMKAAFLKAPNKFPVRKNENPLWLRGLILATKTAMVPWAGLCARGLISPILDGFSLATGLTALTSAAFSFLLWHDLGYVNDISKSLKISQHYPAKGTWPIIPEKRINPAITITSLPESSVLVEGSVYSALRAISNFGRGQAFMVDDSKNICNRFGKQHLATEGNKMFAARNMLMEKAKSFLVEAGFNSYDEKAAAEFAETYGHKGETAINKAKELILAERSRKIADCLCLNCEMELEAAVRQICEKHGVSRAAETKLTNYIGILRTIKETIELEGVEEISDARQKETALREITTKICKINWIKGKEIELLINKWDQNKDGFLLLEKEALAILGIADQDLTLVHDELRQRTRSEESQEKIGKLAVKLFHTGLSMPEKEAFLLVLNAEFPELGESAAQFLSWMEQNKNRLNEESASLAGEFSGISKDTKQKVKLIMDSHLRRENSPSFKEHVRMILEDTFSLSNSEAESIAVKITKKIVVLQGSAAMDFGQISGMKDSELENLISDVIPNTQKKRGLALRLARRVKVEAILINSNISRASDAFIFWSLSAEKQLTKIASEITTANSHAEIERILEKEHLKRELAEEIEPVLSAVLKRLMDLQLPPDKIAMELYLRIPLLVALGISECHRLIDFGESLLETYKETSFCARDQIITAIGSFCADWPDTQIDALSLPDLADHLAKAIEEGADTKEFLRKQLNLPEKTTCLLADRIDYHLKGAALEIIRAQAVENLFEGTLKEHQDVSRIYEASLALFYQLKKGDISPPAASDNAVTFIHRVNNAGGKPGALGDATAGYGIESRINNMVRLIVDTRLAELKSGAIDPHAIPSLITRIDRELCHEFLLEADPAETAHEIIRRLKQGEKAKKIALEMAASWGLPDNRKIKRVLIKIIDEFPLSLETRTAKEITDQLVSQSRLPAEAEIEGRKVFLSSVLYKVAPLIEDALAAAKDGDPLTPDKVMLHLMDALKQKAADSLEPEHKIWQFTSNCLASPLPAVGPEFDVFVQFDGGRNINRDYLEENLAYYLKHPSLFLVQTRQHYGRNRWTHPLLVGADSLNDIFYEHLNFAKTYDNSVFPCGSGSSLPRNSWLWGGEWQEEVIYERAVDKKGRFTNRIASGVQRFVQGLPFGNVLSGIFDVAYSLTALQAGDIAGNAAEKTGIDRKISSIGGRIYYQIEDSVTEDMSSGEKYHRLGYLSIFSPGIYERGKGPLGIKDFMRVQLHRWARGDTGELRLRRENGSSSTLKRLIFDKKSFTPEQRGHYLRDITYYPTSIANAVALSSPFLFLLFSSLPASNLALPIFMTVSSQVLIRTWIYPYSLKQRGVPMKESFASVGFTLLNWHRWMNAFYYAVVKRVKGEFGVTRKEGPNIKLGFRDKESLEASIGPMAMIGLNSAAFPAGLYLSYSSGNIFPAFWGFMGLYYAAIMSLAWKRYNKGASPLPPKDGEELLKVLSESDDFNVANFAINELKREGLSYSRKVIGQAQNIYSQKGFANAPI